MPKEIAPPELMLRHLRPLIHWLDAHQCLHIWIELRGNEIVLHRDDPSLLRRCKSAHVGNWGEFGSLGEFQEAAEKAIDRLWRAAC